MRGQAELVVGSLGRVDAPSFLVRSRWLNAVVGGSGGLSLMSFSVRCGMEARWLALTVVRRLGIEGETRDLWV